MLHLFLHLTSRGRPFGSGVILPRRRPLAAQLQQSAHGGIEDENCLADDVALRVIHEPHRRFEVSDQSFEAQLQVLQSGEWQGNQAVG